MVPLSVRIFIEPAKADFSCDAEIYFRAGLRVIREIGASSELSYDAENFSGLILAAAVFEFLRSATTMSAQSPAVLPG